MKYLCVRVSKVTEICGNAPGFHVEVPHETVMNLFSELQDQFVGLFKSDYSSEVTFVANGKRYAYRGLLVLGVGQRPGYSKFMLENSELITDIENHVAVPLNERTLVSEEDIQQDQLRRMER